MAKRTLFLLDHSDSWQELLKEFLDDTASDIFHAPDAARAMPALDQHKPDIFLIHPELLTLGLTQKIKALAVARPGTLFFRLGPSKSPALNWQATFENPPALGEFQKQVTQHLPFPEKIHLLVIDDEAEVARTIREFFENRTRPAFEIEFADNGKKGLEALKRRRPDVIVLDIKMPVKDGREVYREIRQLAAPVPVIIFFDAVSAEELAEIRRLGRPAVVEKGSRESSMPGMMALIKKLVYFG